MNNISASIKYVQRNRLLVMSKLIEIRLPLPFFDLFGTKLNSGFLGARDISTKNISSATIMLATRSKCVSGILRKCKKNR